MGCGRPVRERLVRGRGLMGAFYARPARTNPGRASSSSDSIRPALRRSMAMAPMRPKDRRESVGALTNGSTSRIQTPLKISGRKPVAEVIRRDP